MAKSAIADGLQNILADTFVLYFKTHSFHWNVTGVHFKPLHDLFMEQYTELWNATDEIAERIRTLNEWAPVSWDQMVAKASLKEVGQLPDANGMVEQLAADNRAIVDVIYPVLKTAQDEGDEVTAGLLTERATIHEKAAWMLESSKQ